MGRGLSRQLFLWFVGSVTVPLVLVAIASSVLISSQLQNARLVDITNALAPTAHGIEASLAELDRIAFSPYLYNELFTLLVYADRGYLVEPPQGMGTAIARAERTYTSTFVKMMFTARQTVRSITFYPANGERQAGYALVRTTPGLREFHSPGYRDSTWYVAAARDGSAVSITSGPEPTVVLATMIRDQDRNRPVGVLLVEASADHLLGGLHDMSVPTADRLVLADSSGEAIAGDVRDWQPEDPDFIPVDVAIPSVEWHLVYQVSRNEARASTALIVGIAVGAAIVTSGFAYAIYRRESRAVVAGTDDIIETLAAMRAGDLSTRSAVESNDWLGTIADSVNHLGAELSTRIEREYKAVIDRQNAEYRALQAQISPHFLYNVFNDFMAMNRLGQRERLEESILRMTRLLRYSCSTAEFATVGQEVAFAGEYLFLRQIQLDERLSYTIDIEPGCRSVTMPRLIVQPLVENAIKHGMPDDRKLTVRVCAEPTAGGQGTRITVRDDGTGFDPERITETSGFATTNIRERLRILSQNSTLEISSEPGAGTVCVLDLQEVP